MVKFIADADAHAPLEICVFNIGANVNFPIVETTERVFRKVWEMACYSGFLAGREAARAMLARGRATSSSRARRQACGAATRFRRFCQRQVRSPSRCAIDGRELGPRTFTSRT